MEAALVTFCVFLQGLLAFHVGRALKGHGRKGALGLFAFVEHDESPDGRGRP